MPVEVGQKAPDFTLPDTARKPQSLSEFLGKKAVLAFFIGAFTSVCTREMCTFRDDLQKLTNLDAQVVGIVVDSPWANRAFAEKHGLTFPILSDYTREVIRKYDIVLNDFSGLKGFAVAKRSIFILDKSGIVRYKWVSDNPAMEPNYEEISKQVQTIK